jgi:CubicO group peptidase (beta-lactamase class C family)
MGVVQGTAEQGYEAVRDLLEQQFAAGEHVGAGVCVYHRGRKVVDIWGGEANRDTHAPWLPDTMAVCYSTTKGLAATCLHVLADRGLVEYQAPVAKYWPEFAQNGKGAITVYHILTHQSGMAPLPDGMAGGPELFDWDAVIHGIEREAPAWEPGTASGYHAMTFGFLVGEIVRRVSGKSVGTFLRDEIAIPLGIGDEMFIGAPESVEPRIAKLVPATTPEGGREMMRMLAETPDGSIMLRSLGVNLDATPEDADWLDTPAGHRAEIPAVSGIMTARALARMYAALANYGELDGVRLMSERTVRAMSALQTRRPDKVIMSVPVGWSLGYMNGGAEGWPQGPRDTSFGHIGLGGSVGYADPEIAMSFGFVPNKLTMDLIGAGRTAALADAARASCEAMG